VRWIKIVLIGAVALLAAIAILVAVLLTMDLGRFKPQVENLVSNQLGRGFRIQGSLQPSLGEKIRVVAEDVRLDNADWASEDFLLGVQRLDVSLDAWALLSGQILIDNIELDDVAIHLEQDDTGLNNWTLAATDPAEESDDAEATLNLLIRQARIRNLSVDYLDPTRDAPLRFQASEIKQVQLDSGDLQLDLDGDLNGTPVTLDATAGTFANLLDAGAVHYDLRGVLGEISIESSAQIDSLAEPGKPVGRLQVSGPNAKYLTDILGIDPITRGPLNLVATVEPVSDKMNLNIQGDFGEFEIDVTGSFSDLQDLDEVNIDFSAGGPNAATLGQLAGRDDIPAVPYAIAGIITRKGATIVVENVAVEIGATTFDLNATIAEFPNIAGSVVSLKINGPEFGRFNKLFGLPGKLTGPFSLTADLSQSPEGNGLVDVSATARDIQFTVTGMVSASPDLVGTELALRVQGDDLSIISGALDIANGPVVPFDVNASVSRIDRGFTIDQGIAKLGGDVIQVEGLIGIEPLVSDTDIKFEISGPDLGRTLTLAEMDPDKIPDGPYQAAGRVYRQDAAFVLEQIVATLGAAPDYRVELDGELTDPPEFIGTSLRFRVNGANLREVAEIAAVAGLPQASFSVSGSVDRVAQGFAIKDGAIRIADDKILINGLVGNQPLERDTDLRFQVSGPDLAGTVKMAGVELDTLPPGDYETAGQIQRKADYFALKGITARLGSTRAELSGRLGNLTDFQGTDIDITIEGDSLAKLVPETSDYALQEKPFKVSSNVQLGQDTLNLRKLTARIGQGELSGDISINMSPMLSSGRVAITAKGPDVAAWIPSFAEYVPVSAPFELQSRVRWQDTGVVIERLSLNLAKSQLLASGEVDLINDLSRTDLRIDTQVASMSNLGRIAGTDLPDEPLTLSAHLIGSADAVRLEDLIATAGKSDLSGNATYKNQGDVPFVDLTLVSKYLNVVPFLPDQEAGAESESAPTVDDSRVIPDTPIPLDQLRQLNARVDISVGEMVLRETTVNDVLLDASLQDGALRINKFGVSGRRGTLAGNLEVLPTAAGAQLNTAIEGTKLTLGLTPSSPDAVDLLPSYDVQVKMAATGATVREMAASLDGTVRLVGASGQTKGIPSWFMRDFASEIVGAVNPLSKKDPYTKIECVTVLLRAIDGQVNGQPALVLQTDKLKIVSVAFIDLGTEKVDATFETSARKGLGIGFTDLITPFTKVSGTMANPKLTLDAGRSGQAAATLGLSIIAKKTKERWFPDKDPCGKEVLKADAEMRALQR